MVRSSASGTFSRTWLNSLAANTPLIEEGAVIRDGSTDVVGSVSQRRLLAAVDSPALVGQLLLKTQRVRDLLALTSVTARASTHSMVWPLHWQLRLQHAVMYHRHADTCTRADPG
jgi:hypothetical protein